MSKRSRKTDFLALGDAFSGVKRRKTLPHEFVLDALSLLSPETRQMFGCVAVYLGDKIVFVLRERNEHRDDNGVWLATSKQHHESLRQEFPNMRSIGVLGKKETAWQILPSDAPDFEEAALRACELILADDPRIGKVPAGRGAREKRAIKPGKSRKRARSSKRAGTGR